MKKVQNKKLIRGQALLLVLLTMSLTLVVVLSNISRSITDVSVTSYQEDSLRAFSAAEAGIEQALLNAVPGSFSGTIDTSTSTSFSAEVKTGDEGKVFEYPDKLNSGEVATFWFVSHDNDGKLTCNDKTCTKTNRLEFCWGDNAAINIYTPAVVITFYYDKTGGSFASNNDFTGLKLKRFTSDPHAGRGNNFDSSASGCTIDSKYKFSKIIQGSDIDDEGNCVVSSNCLVAAKVMMLYNNKPHSLALRVQGDSDLPSQGLVVSSRGKSGLTSRNVNVFQSFPEIPDIFEGVIFSGKSVVK